MNKYVKQAKLVLSDKYSANDYMWISDLPREMQATVLQYTTMEEWHDNDRKAADEARVYFLLLMGEIESCE